MGTIKFYGIAEAAEILGLSISGIKYHIYRAEEKLCPIRVGEGRVLVFTQRMLDQFQANRRKPGRPKTKVKETE